MNRSTATRLRALLSILRPRQWTKNFAVFIGLVFAQKLSNIPSLERTLLAFVIFCLASSCIYILNDLLDLEQDRQHPIKRSRALPSGRLPISWAIGEMVGIALLCGVLTITLFGVPFSTHDVYRQFGGTNLLFALIVAGYLLMMIFYSFRLKHVVLIDVFCIAAGFVLRILAGAVAVPVVISPWLYLVTCFLSLFLAFSKRRHELVLLQGQASSHRQILKEYSIPMLDQMITITVVGTLMAYSLYSFQSPTGDRHPIFVTIPFVFYGIFRYLYLVYMRMEGGSPEEVLLRDRHMLVTVVLCTVLIVSVLYLLP
ncbi:decaprenyl-phosphate phosphoribosyltransferase [Tengunoibacter tsumagoiensis]|uniref:Decaprenyl-phosphate phosphoribosyltransferase n=1 Tax=Tengunoibacter tsumagoiensis TaxID=2014871 RepID=A0A402A3I1_9CHLR|nr:decaprenyl-phosphate phosphoribosyltransferase [Tengunoibacter tsumagoiensis]GCE13595.1 decaprenyl-phosphate phosphoribosyltransferase [Tengunoibacter tsumagoiensis]